MIASPSPWLEPWRFACEVQQVIAMRLMALSRGGPQAENEAQLMVEEKIEAFADAEVALVNALFAGENLLVAGERAYAPLRSRVHANSDRLSHAMD